MVERLLLASPGHTYSTTAWSDGLAAGLSNLVEVIPFNYRSVIRFYELAVPVVAQEFPSFQRLCHNDDDFDMAVKSLASDRLPIAVLESQPDVIVIVNGTLYNPKVYAYLKLLSDELSVPWGVILTESPYEDEEQRVLLDGASFATSNDRISAERIGKRLPTLYLPAGFDSRTWGPLERDIIFDWCFVGTKFPEREAVLEPLIKLSEMQNLRYYVHYPEGSDWIEHEDLCELYNSSKININIHRQSKSIEGGEVPYRPYSLNPRAYEIAATRSFQISDSRPEVADVFGDNVPTWETAEDLVDLILFSLDHPEWRRECAARAYNRVLDHSYDNRAKTLLDFI